MDRIERGETQRCGEPSAGREAYHTVVIGAGPAGMTAAIGLAKFGKRVALVEAGQIGGDCTNVGCIPSKALLHASMLVEDGNLDTADAMRYVHDVRDRVRREDAKLVAEPASLTLVAGRARISALRTVEVLEPSGSIRTLQARHVVVATGTAPVHLEIPGLPEARGFTNETLFELEAAPRSLAIVGGGAIGTEMALAFARLGTRVVLVEASEEILSALEPEVGVTVARRLTSHGVSILTGVRVVGYAAATRAVLLSDGQRIEDIELVLMAAGRRPNTAGLGLELSGARLARGAVVADSWGRTSVPWLQAVGDVTGTQNTTAAANAIARRLVRRLALPFLPTLAPAPVVPAAVFTEPEVASAGPTLGELRRRHPAALIATYRVDLAGLDRAKTDGVEDGFLLVHALRLRGRVLSATWVGPRAADMLPILTLAIQRRMSLYAITDLVFPYPSLAEAIKVVADRFFFDTLAHPGRELGAYLKNRLGKGDAPVRIAASRTEPPSTDRRGPRSDPGQGPSPTSGR